MTTATDRSTASAGNRGAHSVARRALGAIAPQLVRPRDGRVCFASIPDFTDSAYWVYRHLLESRRGLHITWLVNDPGHADRIRADFHASGRAEDHTLDVIAWQSLRGYRAYLRSSVFFHTHGAFTFSRPRPNRRVVSLWHGMPLKVIGFLDDSGLWANDVAGDVHVATSRLFRPIIAASFGVHPGSVRMTGLPRCDVLKGLMPPVSDRATIATTLGLDPDRPIVLWLPTHRRDTEHDGGASFLDQIEPEVLDSLVDACEVHGCQVVVKLHHLDTLNDGGAEPLTARGLTLVGSEAWSRAGIQLYDVLATSDGLLTDLSSAIVDFFHTGRPIGIIGYDESTYGRDMIVPVGHLATSAAVFPLTDTTSVGSFINQVDKRETIELPDDDVARWLNEDWTVHSSDRVLREAGL